MKKPTIILGVLLASATAFAGLKSSAPVYIGTNMAAGSLGTARNGTDALQYMECFTMTTVGATATTTSLACYARDIAGKSVACYGTNPALVAQVRALKGDSFLQFSWDANGQCTQIWVNDSSGYAPKNP